MILPGPRSRPRRPQRFPRVREDAFQRQVVRLAETLGWMAMHVRPGVEGKPRADGAKVWRTPTTLSGWPDLSLIRPPRLVFLELKGNDGSLRPDQRAVLDSLACCPGVEAYVAWPWDLDDLVSLLSKSHRRNYAAVSSPQPGDESVDERGVSTG